MGVLNVFLLLIVACLVSSKEYMPVLSWSSKGDKPFADVSAFTKLSTTEFFDNIAKKVKLEKPTILVFMEENLSVEDFSWRDISGSTAYPLMKNISESVDDLTYLPSVQNPIKGLETLMKIGYVWKPYSKENLGTVGNDEKTIYEVKLSEPGYLENRPDMLRTHDQQIQEVYNEVLSHNPNVMVVYSGHHNSWIDNELTRFKRQAGEENTTSTLVIEDEKGVVKMSVTPPILYKSKEPSEGPVVVKITKVIGTPTTDVEKDKISMTVRFSFNEKTISVKFKFSSIENEWWTMDSAEIPDFKQKNLNPTVEVGAPAGYSYFCNPTVEFVNSTVSLTFENLQVQPRVGKGKDFGPVMHCIPYFSIAIWSGLVVVFILSVVLGWGIVMIMDINTNDRFDDPKGKTITISATD